MTDTEQRNQIAIIVGSYWQGQLLSMVLDANGSDTVVATQAVLTTYASILGALAGLVDPVLLGIDPDSTQAEQIRLLVGQPT